MNLSAPFVHRPVATTLLTIGLALAGLLAVRLLPVSPLPEVDLPTIAVSANMPGASPETMAATVATPLERQFGRIAGVTELTSWSTLGNTRIILQFDLGRSIEGAARDVQAAINAARIDLPANLPNNPTYRKVNPADAPIMILVLTSDTLDKGQVYDIANTMLVPVLSQVDGVGQASISGSSSPAVRIELNPNALNRYGIGLEDVRTAIAATNANKPKGFVENDDYRWQIMANDQAFRAADYRPIVVANRNGAQVTLGDVAEVVDSVQDLRNAGIADGQAAVLVVISRQPGANIIETVDRIKELVPSMRASIPASVELRIGQDRTATIRASLKDIEHTLYIAVVLVVLVVAAFLRQPTAAIIPSVALPISLLATFAVMYALGYSINNFSLTAMIVATGFVVDDAIVVLENTMRHVEAGERPFAAAIKGAQEVGFTVVSMSLSLIAVFIPILFLGGIVGKLSREFAVTLSVAILISLLISLTTTPMMCAYLLKHTAEKPPGKLARWAARAYDWILGGYRVSLSWVLRHPKLTLTLLLAAIGLNVYLYVIVPKGLFPQQDTGRLVGSIQAAQGTSFQEMERKLTTFVNIVRRDPAVTEVVGFTGGGQRNSGFMFVALKPREERPETADQVISRIRQATARVPGASLYLQAAQEFRTGGRQSNSQFQYTLLGDDIAELRAWTPKIVDALSTLPEIADANTDLQDKGLQISVDYDRVAAGRLGVSPRAIDQALYDAFGQRLVSTVYTPINQYRVVMEVAPQYWQRPESLDLIQIRTAAGNQIPLGSFAKYSPTTTPTAVNHQSQFAATTFSFNLADGVSIGQAAEAIENLMTRLGVPSSIFRGFQGTARTFQSALANQPMLILAALIAVYIVLGILYESLVHPLTILSTLPSAGVGALLALIATGREFSIIALIAVFLLIGIVKKNAIMMIDFALIAEREQGMTPEQAIFEACILRFRPIMMTTFAALFGALPLAIGDGEGAEMRHPLGIAVVGGLLVSQILTLYTTPVVYLSLERLRLKWHRRSGRAHAAPAE